MVGTGTRVMAVTHLYAPAHVYFSSRTWGPIITESHNRVRQACSRFWGLPRRRTGDPSACMTFFHRHACSRNCRSLLGLSSAIADEFYLKNNENFKSP